MRFSLNTKLQLTGLALYMVGLVLYFLSWLLQRYFPELDWSKSVFGFIAPAYTTLIWFVGIGFVGNKTFVKIPYISLLYILISVCLVVVHTLRAYKVYHKI
ncbi:hypothetical protein SAMN05421636_1109 [Pricia antarctica]|uniref:Uncharacterized protein n=1 Tax=Pricia antarctica TaxID=641691 RepID=A0A1G7HQL1_9FLAO|nr:hypothetical protein SAMN05421636_1109 [Pricia antarctica]